ncbi:hypothetical protein [Mucilaginibacter endophyticus]|uniref:hypothetical protein n=1 Tax=Mucilaginibacter endophyticus TaxID=2675003 RepID=UPI0012B17721|nr:hypothetical protein [Mucilaginibacter endophyticus]
MKNRTNRVRPNVTGEDFLERVPDEKAKAVSRGFLGKHPIDELYFQKLKSGLKRLLPKKIINPGLIILLGLNELG